MATSIGVYFDMSAIQGGLDVESLIEGVITRFGELTPVVKAFPVMADECSRSEITADIKENNLDGVLLCGSSPRFDWDLYQFENVLVERVNLREGCILPFMDADGSPLPQEANDEDAPELLYLAAVDYINMGIIRLQKTNTPQPESFETFKQILVLGGGWTGLAAAKSAVKMGYSVTLVEKADQLGGKANNMLKTIPLSAPYSELHPTNIKDKAESVLAEKEITVFTSSQLSKLSGSPGEFIATISTPEGDKEVNVGAVVLATGWLPLNKEVLAPLGMGKSPIVVTSAEFELMARDKKIQANRVAFILNTALCNQDESKPVHDSEESSSEQVDQQAQQPEGNFENQTESAANTFTDMESYKHLGYSKAVSSMVALKQAVYVAEKPEGIAYVLYDDIMALGVHERFYKAAQNNTRIMLTKADIAEVNVEGSHAKVVANNTLLGGSIELDVDMVVLPTGMVPTTAKSSVIELNYRQGPAFPDLDLFDGFADSNYICFPYETRRTGVYAAGCVRQPMTMDTAEEDAQGAVLKAIQCIESSNRGVAVHPRSGDLSYPIFNFVRCTQCKRCTEECPFGALEDDEKGTPKPNPSRCRRCGTCMGACPERVISFDNYNIDQIGSMIRDIKVPDDMAKDGPRVLILACENDAYPAFDMAAMRGHHWSPYVRIIPIRCLGSVNAIWIADAMSKGIDGVMLMGCKYGDDYQCHFVKGSEICNRRKENIAETLNRLGVEPDRVAQYQVAIDEYDLVPGMVEEFLDMIFTKGPNPFKGY